MKQIFFYPLTVFAASIGNPSTPALLEEGLFIPDQTWSSPQAAYEGDFLLEKKLKSQSDSGIEKAQLEGNSQLGELAWCIRERFLLQVELGTGAFKWRWNGSNLSFSEKVNGGLIYNGSAKLLILEVKETSIAVDGHVGGWSGMKGNSGSAHFRYWQFAVGLTQKIGMFAPYAGVAINQSRYKIDQIYFRGEETVGPFLGCSLTNGALIFLNLEWRGWFEEGLSLSGQIRF